MSKKLSIIIPCFNCATTLEAAVASCYDQGFTPEEFEIVLINDASTDTTSIVIAVLAKKYPNLITDTHPSNQGGGATRNSAAARATAPIMFCLDSDDLLPTGTLHLLYTHLITKNCDGVGINTSIKFNGNDTTNHEAVHTFIRVNEKIELADLLQRNGLCSLYSTFMLTKSAFEQAGGYPTEHGFDTQGFAWRFLAAGLYAETCPNATYLHRVHAGVSYYEREFQSGKVNFNWQKIFIEHSSLFTPILQQFILTFPCVDFTRNLFDEVVAHEVVLATNRQNVTSTPPTSRLFETPISRTSLRGRLLRIRYRVKQIIKNSPTLKNLLLEMHLTYEDCITRGHSTTPLRLLFAYTILRLKKIFQYDFSRSKTLSSEYIDIVIPTIGKDLPVFKLYIQYLRKNILHPIGNIYVVSATSELTLQEYCREEGLIFIDETSVLGYGKNHITYHSNGHNRSGWLFQQLLKLSGEVFVTHKKYIIVDSDTLIVRPLSFLQNEKSVFFESREWNQPYFVAIKTLFGFTAPHPYSLTSHMMIFDTDRLREMKAEIEVKHTISWDKAYIASCDTSKPSGISDYETYAQWMIKRHPDEVYTTPFYNASLSRKAFFEGQISPEDFQHRAHSLSLHSYN